MSHVDQSPLPFPDWDWQPEDGGPPIPHRSRITVWCDAFGQPLSGSVETFWNRKRTGCVVEDADPETTADTMWRRLYRQTRTAPLSQPFA